MTLEDWIKDRTDDRGRPRQTQIQLPKKLGVRKQIRLEDLR
jgi:hypothetical protein